MGKIIEKNSDLIFLGKDFKDIQKANETKKLQFFWFSKIAHHRG